VWPDEEASAKPLREIGQKAEGEGIRLEFDDYSFDLIDDRKMDLFEKGGRMQGQLLCTVNPDFDLTRTGAMLKDLIAPPKYRKAQLMNEAVGYDIVNEKEPKRVTKLLE
jgi:hypothetical protein